MSPVPHLGFPPETLILFLVLTLGGLVVDLIVHRRDRPVSIRSALTWAAFWLCLAALFAGFLFYHHGQETAGLFVTGYLMEQVLSVDNLFVMMAVFSWFRIPERFQHRVLYWGILGAMLFRAIFVLIGAELFELGPWAEIVFALIVGWTALLMLRKKEDDANESVNYSGHLAYRLVRWIFPLYPQLSGHRFFVTRKQIIAESACHSVLGNSPDECMQHRKVSMPVWATPLFLCLMVIEFSDVIFAFDSVPAVIAVSREPLIVYSAMMLAILGLRSFYFVLQMLKHHLVHLEKAITVLLFFITFELLLEASDDLWHHGYEISSRTSLSIVLGVLVIGILASVFAKKPVHADESGTEHS